MQASLHMDQDAMYFVSGFDYSFAAYYSAGRRRRQRQRRWGLRLSYLLPVVHLGYL